MKLENQVCALEYSKKLKELGVKQESLFYWSHSQRTGWFLANRRDVLIGEENVPIENAVSAFTVAELGEMLQSPLGVMPIMYSDLGQWYFWPSEELAKNLPHPRLPVSANTEADARAKMLIYLLENKLI